MNDSDDRKTEEDAAAKREIAARIAEEREAVEKDFARFEVGTELLSDFKPPNHWDAIAMDGIQPSQLPYQIALRLNWFRKRGRKIEDSSEAAFFTALREHVDQWLDSGREGKTDRPETRSIFWCSSPKYRESLFSLLNRFAQEASVTTVGEDGVSVRLRVPLRKRGSMAAQLRDSAKLVFINLLKSPNRYKLFRCDHCGLYDLRQREPREETLHGTFCDTCKKTSTPSAERTEASRNDRLLILAELAAKWWPKWSSKENPSRSKWIAKKMTDSGLPNWQPSITGNWVTRHVKEIEAALEADRRKHAGED